jgi:hypothetical protein
MDVLWSSKSNRLLGIKRTHHTPAVGDGWGADEKTEITSRGWEFL